MNFNKQILVQTTDRLGLCTHLCKFSSWELRFRGSWDNALGACDHGLRDGRRVNGGGEHKDLNDKWEKEGVNFYKTDWSGNPVGKIKDRIIKNCIVIQIQEDMN